MPTGTFLVQWLATWLILAVVFYVATEFMQRALYEFVIEGLGWRVMAVTPLLAAVLVKWPVPFSEWFSNLSGLFLQALFWFIACWLALRFQWMHAIGISLMAVLLIAPMASTAVDNLVQRETTGPPPQAAASPQTPPPP